MAEFIKLYNENPNQKQIDKVVKVLKNGGLIIYPTDTVYGLGCDITNIKALERIAQIKGVKLEKANFSFVCNDLSHLSDYIKQIDGGRLLSAYFDLDEIDIRFIKDNFNAKIFIKDSYYYVNKIIDYKHFML